MSGFQNKTRQIAKDIDKYLKHYFKKQNVKSSLLKSMKYGLFSGGKGFRSKIIVDTAKIFDIDYNLSKALSSNFSPGSIADMDLDSSEMNSDIHASAEYRASLVVTQAKKAVEACK